MARKLAQFFLALLTLILLSPRPSLAQPPTPHFEFLSQPLTFYASDSVVSGNTAYVAAREDLYVFDISDPGQPSPMGPPLHVENCHFGAIDLVEPDVIVTQNFYGCPRPYNFLAIVDVSDPSSPEQVGESIDIVGAAYELAVEGGYAFVANGAGGLTIVNLSSRDTYNFTPNGAYFEDIKIAGDIAYLTDGSHKLWLLDISDKENINASDVLDTLEFSNHVTGVDVAGNYAYVSLAAFLPAGNGGLGVINVANPRNIYEAGRAPMPDPHAARDVEVEGSYAFVVDDHSKLVAFDISVPSIPTPVAEYQMTDEGRLTVSGDLILASNGFGGLVILRFTGLAPSAPTPFLDLPWDYDAKGMVFREAALAINSYFDHRYPLLKFLNESTRQCSPAPIEIPLEITKYTGVTAQEDEYHCHDGYDYGKRLAKLQLGDSVLAAASGCAVYRHSNAGGNEIRIDHGNGYQSRYLHLQGGDTLITQETDPADCVDVERGQPIGKVGFSGRVLPPGEAGSHLHFMVVQSKDGDNDFDEDYPWGLVDPFGWEGEEDDPWASFSWNGNLGNTSRYLWIGDIRGFSGNLTKSELNLVQTERFTYEFPENTFVQDVHIEERGGPVTRGIHTLESIGSTSILTVRDFLGNIVSFILRPFKLTINFSGFDLSRYNPNTLSIYSSEDGKVWNREETTIDFGMGIASAEINHLSYFALMAEKLDVLPPSTNAELEGEEGTDGWFRSDVVLTLEVTDNESGLGVDYAVYKVNDEDWQQYLNPISFTAEGHYKIDFYSVDNDENIEEIKTVEFNIDKTIPIGSITAIPDKLWPPNGKMVDVIINGSAFDENISEIKFKVEDEYDEIEPIITSFGQIFKLKAERNGKDTDGRIYTIKVIITDRARNIAEYSTQVLVPHDLGKD